MEDKKRTELIKFQGLGVRRFTNKEVLTNIDAVLVKITEVIDDIKYS